jgi:hypothetical protein
MVCLALLGVKRPRSEPVRPEPFLRPSCPYSTAFRVKSKLVLKPEVSSFIVSFA